MQQRAYVLKHNQLEMEKRKIRQLQKKIKIHKELEQTMGFIEQFGFKKILLSEPQFNVYTDIDNFHCPANEAEAINLKENSNLDRKKDDPTVKLF